MAFGNVMGKLEDFNSKYRIGQKASSALHGVKTVTVKGSKQVAKVVTGKKASKESSATAALPDDSMWEYAEQHAAKPLEDRSRNGAKTRAPLEEVRYDTYESHQVGADIWEHEKTNSFKTREEENKRVAAAKGTRPRGPFDTSANDGYTFRAPEPEGYKVFLPGYNFKSSYERANEKAARPTPVRSNSNPFDDPRQ